MIEKAVLRALVLEVLGRESATQLNSIISAVETLVRERELFPSREDCDQSDVEYRYYEQRQLNPMDNQIIREIAWDLVAERIVTPGARSDINSHFPHLMLTDFGRDIIISSIPHYYDPQGYMEFLSRTVPDLDPIIQQYLSESLKCFRQQLFFASAVMLGAAAEKAVLLLLQDMANSMSDPDKKRRAEGLLDTGRLPAIFKTITETIDQLVKNDIMPYPVHQGCTQHLPSLFEMIRVQRNDAVHPQCGEANRDKVFISLQTIPVGLEHLSKLIDWFKHNPIP